jgi:hypothetical protein
MEFSPAVGNASCPICVLPIAIEGPTGCFGCPPTEKFPPVWNFSEEFVVSGDASETVTTSNASTYSILANVPPGSTGPATATVVKVMPGEIKSKPLICVMASAGSSVFPGCAWGNGAWKYDAWLYKPTYGSPSPSPGGCGLTPGFLEQRTSVSGAGPWMYPSGASAVGSALGACYGPKQFYYYSGMPETYWGRGLAPYPDFNGSSLLHPVDLGGCTLGTQQWYMTATRDACWNWYLSSGGGSSVVLRLHVIGYSYIRVSPVVFDGTRYCHAYFPPHCTALSPLFGALSNNLTSGFASWAGTYPCGTPDSITLTLTGRSGCLGDGLATLPETVTLNRG